MLYHVRLSENEFNTLKGLVLRWKIEIESGVTAVEEMPHSMRQAAYNELEAASIKADNICREFGIDP